MSKIIELAKKLKALSERGEHGEKHNAADMLTKLLKKHDLSVEDIEREEISSHFLSFKLKQETLLTQIIYSILGHRMKLYPHVSLKTKMMVKCTSAEFIEIEAAFPFYWNKYEKELGLFDKAFTYKNYLFPKNSDSSKNKKQEKITDEEAEKIVQMMSSIDGSKHHKQINQ